MLSCHGKDSVTVGEVTVYPDICISPYRYNEAPAFPKPKSPSSNLRSCFAPPSPLVFSVCRWGLSRLSESPLSPARNPRRVSHKEATEEHRSGAVDRQRVFFFLLPESHANDFESCNTRPTTARHSGLSIAPTYRLEYSVDGAARVNRTKWRGSTQMSTRTCRGPTGTTTASTSVSGPLGEKRRD